MNRLQHLLWIISEECAEISQRASKAARFGISEIQEGQELSNEERLWGELNDLAGVAELLIKHRGSGGLVREQMEAKKVKVEKFLLYSEKCGTLDSE